MVGPSVLGLGARVAHGALVLMFVAACALQPGERPVQPDEHPMIDVWYLNPTPDLVELRTESREPDSNSGTDGDVRPCDIGGASWSLVERQTWKVVVNGVVVLDSSDDLPNPGPGEALEVVLTRRLDGTHIVESARVRPHLSEAESGDRHQALRAEMDC